MRTIDADALKDAMYTETMLKDTDMQRWDSGCWIRYKLFENVLREQPTIDAEPRWIPVSERLPEEDVDVLISYRYREGEGDTRHTRIDITSFGQVYFGGHKVGNHTHWRPPFEYFESNYEVVAWMPLPKPYQEKKDASVE